MSEQMYVSADSPTTCARSGQTMTLEGDRWVHEAGGCPDVNHFRKDTI